MKLTTIKLITTLAAACTMQANAQTMYRCGTTYSQTPCGVDQKEIELNVSDQCDFEENRMSSACIMRPSKPYKPYQPSAAEKRLRTKDMVEKQQLEAENKETLRKLNLFVPDPALVEGNKKVCLANVTVALKDPESAKLGKVVRIGAEMDIQHGYPTPTIMYTMMINAKNSYGAYTGSKTHICVFSTDEKRFIRTLSP